MRIESINEESKKIIDEINKISQVKNKGIELVNKYTTTDISNLDEKSCMEIVNKIKPILKN